MAFFELEIGILENKGRIWDLTPFGIGNLTPFEIGIWDLTPFEIGFFGFQDPPYTPLRTTTSLFGCSSVHPFVCMCLGQLFLHDRIFEMNGL